MVLLVKVIRVAIQVGLCFAVQAVAVVHQQLVRMAFPIANQALVALVRRHQ
jgi:hypothetical protein